MLNTNLNVLADSDNADTLNESHTAPSEDDAQKEASQDKLRPGNVISGVFRLSQIRTSSRDEMKIFS